MIATAPVDILSFILARAQEGVATILVTLTGIEGASPRALGAQMAVAADGRYAGSFSGGCVEAAVVAEAIGTLSDGRAKIVRFGAGSPYIDIRLPCGSGIDLLFNPHPDAQVIAEAVARHERREVALLQLSNNGVRLEPASRGANGTGWNDEHFLRRYPPTLRIAAMGQGEELLALARLAHVFGADFTALSPDRQTLAELGAAGFGTIALTTRSHFPPMITDAWTAIVSVFHDRDWEEDLLPHALRLSSFYIGAIGSRRTQGDRLDALRMAGVPDHLCQKLRTSVGLIPATRDPATLALSILSQIADDYHRIDSRPALPAAVSPDRTERGRVSQAIAIPG